MSASRNSATAGTTVTITVEPDSGCEVDKLTVTNTAGEELKLTKKGDTQYTFTMPDSKVGVNVNFSKESISSSGLPFTDVSSSDWYFDEVTYVYENGVMVGTSNTTFSPESSTTRGMIVTMLYRMEGSPVAEASTFTDVEAGAYYADAVAWANANGIVLGYSDDPFGPNDTIAREQVATILYRYASYKNYDVTASADLSGYSDASSISSYALVAMSWANAEGLITGTDANTLAPQGDATRAQIATIFARFAETVAI